MLVGSKADFPLHLLGIRCLRSVVFVTPSVSFAAFRIRNLPSNDSIHRIRTKDNWLDLKSLVDQKWNNFLIYRSEASFNQKNDVNSLSSLKVCKSGFLKKRITSRIDEECPMNNQKIWKRGQNSQVWVSSLLKSSFGSSFLDLHFVGEAPLVLHTPRGLHRSNDLAKVRMYPDHLELIKIKIGWKKELFRQLRICPYFDANGFRMWGILVCQCSIQDHERSKRCTDLWIHV